MLNFVFIIKTMRRTPRKPALLNRQPPWPWLRKGYAFDMYMLLHMPWHSCITLVGNVQETVTAKANPPQPTSTVTGEDIFFCCSKPVRCSKSLGLGICRIAVLQRAYRHLQAFFKGRTSMWCAYGVSPEML